MFISPRGWGMDVRTSRAALLRRFVLGWILECPGELKRRVCQGPPRHDLISSGKGLGCLLNVFFFFFFKFHQAILMCLWVQKIIERERELSDWKWPVSLLYWSRRAVAWRLIKGLWIYNGKSSFDSRGRTQKEIRLWEWLLRSPDSSQ